MAYFKSVSIVLRARPVLKLLERLLPELYSTQSNTITYYDYDYDYGSCYYYYYYYYY